MKIPNPIIPIRNSLKHLAHAISPVILACCLASQAQAQDIVTPIAATSQSYYSGDDRAPIHAIDGTGMTPDNPVTASSTCGNDPGHNMWLSDGNQDTWITFDLGSIQTISGFHLWNYNEINGNYNGRGIKTAGIYAGNTLPDQDSSYASGGAAWGTLVEDMTFTKATGTTSYTGEDYTFATPVTTRYIQIYVTSNFGTQDDYTGISEIRFYRPLELAVTLASPADAVAFPTGTSVMATANVTDPGDFTHTVTFHTTPISPSGSTVDTVSTDTSSPFSVDLGALAAGTYQIYATVVNSDTTPGTATSATRTFTVAPAVPTTTTLASPATPSIYGQNVTFTATVSPTPTGGKVQFFDGGSPLGSPATVNTTTGEATYSSTALGVGTHVITAQYNGYQIYETSTTAASISQVVDKAPLTVTALNMFRTVNTANPDPFPYQITGYQNGQTLATSGVTGTPVLTTDATLSSPVGNYVITCALDTLAASNYSFTLENGTLTITDLACQVGVLKLGANGGINPATGVAWALGDRYRLIFVTSADTACDSTDITTYNSFVQGLAAASTSYPKLGSVTWKVVGSTASVDARDNTSTNPSVNGVGEPILRMDGLFVIANNYADLWDGAINSSHVPGQNYLAVAFDENGVERIEERVRTGSSGNGTATSVLGGSGDVQTGRNYTPDFYGGYGGWMQDWSASAASAGPVYAMSETLTIQSTNPADPYGNWASTQGLTGTAGSSTDPAFDADPNKDGVANGLVWLIGGADANPLANNNAILPVPTADGGKLVLTFKCLKSSARGTANLTVEYSMDLGGAADAWHPVSVPDADQADGGSGVGFVVTPIAGSDYNNVTATIAAPALGSKLFGRLMATE